MEKNGLHFEIARLFRAILQFNTMQRCLSVKFGTKARKSCNETPDFTHYSLERITSIAVIVSLQLNFKNIQSILRHTVKYNLQCLHEIYVTMTSFSGFFCCCC